MSLGQLPYAVEDWGAHPDDDADCCWTASEYPTLEAAQAAITYELQSGDPDTACFILVGPGIREIHRNPTFNRARAKAQAAADDAACRREIAMEAGLLHGVAAYNDMMGQSLEAPEELQQHLVRTQEGE